MAGTAGSAREVREKLLDCYNESIAVRRAEAGAGAAGGVADAGGTGKATGVAGAGAALVQYYDAEVESYVDLLDEDASWQVRPESCPCMRQRTPKLSLTHSHARARTKDFVKTPVKKLRILLPSQPASPATLLGHGEGQQQAGIEGQRESESARERGHDGAESTLATVKRSKKRGRGSGGGCGGGEDGESGSSSASEEESGIFEGDTTKEVSVVSLFLNVFYFLDGCFFCIQCGAFCILSCRAQASITEKSSFRAETLRRAGWLGCFLFLLCKPTKRIHRNVNPPRKSIYMARYATAMNQELNPTT